MSGLCAAVDVHYLGAAGARAAMVAAADEEFSVITDTRTAVVPAAAPYQPGEFHLRELPTLRAVCQGAAGLTLIVVDGYADLDPDGRPGLGARVHAEFGVPVIGVAKTAFRTATHAARVCRGQAARPVCVTAAGMSVVTAARLVEKMSGPFRIPSALRLADRLARGIEQPSAQTRGPRQPSGTPCER